MMVSSAVVRKMVVATAVLAATVSFAPAANALQYTTSGSPEQFSLGDTLGLASNYDQLIITGVTGNLPATSGQIVLNSLTFIAGVNAIVPQVYKNVFSFTETMTIGTGTGTLVVPFNLSINYSDTLTVIGGTTLSILNGTNLWKIVVNSLTIGPNPGGAMTANLTAQVSDPPVGTTPLPPALLLFATGLGAMGLFGRRRQRKASAIVAV